MARIKFGVGIYGTDNAHEAVTLARTAEALGYDRFWIGDSHMIWRELYVLAGAIAMATLHELTSGRVFLGFGVGASGPANVGMQAVTVTEFEADILSLKQLLRGEPVEFNGTAAKCLFPCGEIPIYIGTRAPQVMKMACRLTAGFIHAGASDSLTELVQQIQSYAQAAGRKPGEVEFIYRLPCAIDDDAAQAGNAVKGVVARTAMTQLGRLYDRGQLEDPEDRSAIARMRQEYNTSRHMDAAHGYLVRDQWLERFALAGRADRLRAKVQQFLAAGIDELTIIPCGPSKQTTVERFARDIMDKI